MRFDPEALHGANAGLHVARGLMEKVKQEFPWISYGDLWTLAGVAAVQEMGGPIIPWRPGRIDGFAHQATPDGRLPDATQGSDHLRNVSIVLPVSISVFLRNNVLDLLPHGVRNKLKLQLTYSYAMADDTYTCIASTTRRSLLSLVHTHSVAATPTARVSMAHGPSRPRL
jgi:hypothetical protein